MNKQIFIHQLDLKVDLTKDGNFLISNEITLDENKQYTFEIVKDELVTGIKIHRTPSEQPIISKEEMKQRFDKKNWDHFRIAHTGKDKIIITVFDNEDEVVRYVKQSEKKEIPLNVPGPVQNLEGSIISPSSVIITWNPPRLDENTPDVTHYEYNNGIDDEWIKIPLMEVRIA